MFVYVVLLVQVYIVNLAQGGVIRIVNATACDFPKTPNGTYLEFEANIQNGAFSGTFKIPFAINDSITYQLQLNEFVDGKYVKSDATLEGYFCDAVELYIPTIWKKVATIMKQEETCPYKPGTYTIEGLTLAMSDLDMTMDGPAGKFMVEVIYKKDDVPVGCVDIMVESD